VIWLLIITKRSGWANKKKTTKKKKKKPKKKKKQNKTKEIKLAMTA
jgi:hypothetical protein